MKKSVIALLLSIVLVAGNSVTASVFAAETAEETKAEEVVASEEGESLEEAVSEDIEVTDSYQTDEEVKEEGGQAEEEPVQEYVESVDEADKTTDVEEPNDEQEELADQALTDESDVEDEDNEIGSAEELSSEEISEIEDPAMIEEGTAITEENEALLADNVIDSGTCGDDATWALSISGEKLILTIGGSGRMTDYSKGKAPWYNLRSSINSVVISEGITHIGTYSFHELKMTEATIKNGVTSIGKYAFYNCTDLKSITIPSSVTMIDWYSFNGCRSLKKLTIPDSITRITDYAFGRCSSLTDVTIPSSVTNIGTYAFSSCYGLTSITIPANVTSVSYNAFNKCINLRSVTVQDGVEKLSGFNECSSLTSITIPSSVTSIGDFNGCTSLKSITIPDGVTSIGSFIGCTSLTSLTIPDGVTSIGSFEGCTSLTSIIIPDSVSSIGGFLNCSSLKSIRIPIGVRTITQHAFDNCSSLRSITIPDSVTRIGNRAFRGCDALTSITLPKGLEYIGEYAFGNQETITIRFRGTQSQWGSAVQKRIVCYKKLICGNFSVDADFELLKYAFNYTGNAIKPDITVKYNGLQLVKGKDYNLIFINNTNLGSAFIYVNGIGDYFGTAQVEFKIVLGATKKVTCTNVASGMKVSWEKVNGATRYKVYRGNDLIFTTSALAVTDKDIKYNSGTKYTYKVVATAKDYGDSQQSRTGTTYRLMPVGIKSLSNPSAGKMTVTYDKSAGSSGYVVRYGLNSDMSDAKVITVQGQDTLSRTFAGMQKGKIYYVQVRTYRIDNGVRYYSGYCTTKTIVIQK